MRASPMLRTAARRIGATTSALFVLALVGAVVAGAYLRPVPEVDDLPVPEIEVGAGPLSMVCPGAPRLATGDGGDITYDDEFGSGEQPRTVTEATVIGRDGEDPAPMVATEPGSDETVTAEVEGDLGRLELDGVEAPHVLRADPSADRTAFVTGATTARTDAGDLRGLAAASCQVPSSTQWLVGGATELGSSARLTVTNPGDTPVTAVVDVWGATGPVAMGSTLLVAPGETESVLLEALSVEPRLAVRVSADGGRVVASIQDSALAGVVPAGTDIVTPAADPDTDLTIGPVPLVESVAPDAPASLVRLVNPGAEPVTVAVSLLGAEGEEVLPGAEAMVLEAGTVSDVTLAGVAAGSWSVRVTSDAPVTGAVMLTRQGEAGELDPDQPVLDRAWLPAARPTDLGALTLPVAGGLVDDRQVAVTNPSEDAQEVTLQAFDEAGVAGDPWTVTVPARSTLDVSGRPELSGAEVVVMRGDAVLASVGITADAADGPLIGMLGLAADPDDRQTVPVRVGSH